MTNPMESTDIIPERKKISDTYLHKQNSTTNVTNIIKNENDTQKNENNVTENNQNSITNLLQQDYITANDIEQALKDVIDPELGINIVDLGLIYAISLDENGKAVIDMTLTSPACPLTDMLQTQIQYVLSGLVEEIEINWVWLPPWSTDNITPDGREQLQALGFNI